MGDGSGVLEKNIEQYWEKTAKKLRKAALAYKALCTCYRIGRNPSESLFNELDKAAKTLEEYNKP